MDRVSRLSGSAWYRHYVSFGAYKPGKAPALDAARTTRTFQVFEKFNQVPLYRLYPLVDVMRVELIDLRFGPLTGSSFTAKAMVEPDGRIADVSFGFGR